MPETSAAQELAYRTCIQDEQGAIGVDDIPDAVITVFLVDVLWKVLGGHDECLLSVVEEICAKIH